MWPFSSKIKAPPRAAIDGATVKALLDLALRGRQRHDYRHFAQKDAMSVITRADVDAASHRAWWTPWSAGKWECEDFGRATVHEAQKIAANEGRSWAIGTLRARAPRGLDLHVYVWAIVQTEGRFAGRDVVFYDPTARSWTSAAQLNNVDYSMT